MAVCRSTSERKILRLVLPTAMSLVLSGCSSPGVGYLFQAGKGQLSLFTHARPIPEVIRDEKTPPRIRALLQEIEPIKKFGESHGLKPTQNYTEYVKLNRSAAVYVVSACESLRFKSKEWSFPIVGSFPYLGWFDLDAAKDYAKELKKEGWDVDLRGASAYSTLGWFRDAVLSSMIPEGKEALGELVNVVIHESVHATLYINGQAYFNESIASFIADHLTLVYLDEKRGPNSPEKLDYLSSEERSKQIQKRLHEAYQKLDHLYASSASDSEKLARKGKILSSLQQELQLRREINNATLIQYKTYNTGQKEFDDLLTACGKDWGKLLMSLKTLTPKSFSQPHENNLVPVVQSLVRAGCPQAVEK
jgi:predicted aminopeptidase